MKYSIAVCCAVTSLSVFAQTKEYRLEDLGNNVYRYVAGNYRALVLNTADGVVLVDPLNQDAAQWLKNTVKTRFNKPVVFISHEDARANLVRTQAETTIPSNVFSDSFTLYAGEKQINLEYLGPNNGYGNVAVRVQPDNLLMVVDWITLGRLPYKNLMGYDIEGMITSTETILREPFDQFVGGHADTGNYEDVENYHEYLVTLHQTVLDSILAGKSLSEIQKTDALSAWSDLKMYDEWVGLNIEGVYNQLISRSYLEMRP